MEKSTLLFFRSRPQGLASNAALLSSMQSLESSFFLIALRRYPHALSTCASAFEMAIQAAPIGAGKDNRLQTLIAKARHNSAAIARIPQDRLDQFRDARNRIIHRGFGPKDASESTSLYLEIALPLLEASYRDFHSYDVTDALLQEYVELLKVAQEVHRRAKTLQGYDLSYSLNAFGHLIRWRFKENFSTGWEIHALDHADEIGLKFENIEREKERLGRLFGPSWSFDCPLCNQPQSVVAELDETELDTLEVTPKRMACTVCGFVVHELHLFLSEVLLQNQIVNARSQILKEYGLE